MQPNSDPSRSTSRGPAGVNGGASALVAPALPGQSARDLKRERSNLDVTGTRLVKRGVVVQWPGGFTAKVVRVRMGAFATSAGWSFTPCCLVRVVSQ